MKIKTNTEPILFGLESFVNKKDKFHLSRSTITSASDLKLHRHNFAEIFWVKEGNGIHLINGEELDLKPGSICMIRPEDYHTFIPKEVNKGITITNLAFSKENLIWLKERYFTGTKFFFDPGSKLPYTTVINKTKLNELSCLTDWTITHSKNNLYLDSLIVFIFRMLIEHERDKSLPHWLSYALENYNSPEYFSKGTKGFLELSGKSLDHVNRILKHHFNQTLTETMNKSRMNYAAKQLIMTNASIKWICDMCGFKNLSHFYKLFKKQFGISPSEYRKLNHKIF